MCGKHKTAVGAEAPKRFAKAITCRLKLKITDGMRMPKCPSRARERDDTGSHTADYDGNCEQAGDGEVCLHEKRARTDTGKHARPFRCVRE